MTHYKSNFEEFEKWLDLNYQYEKRGESIQFISGRLYADYMELVMEDFGCTPEEFKLKFLPGILRQFIRSLRKSCLFKQRSIKEQSDLISALKAYKAYKEYLKAVSKKSDYDKAA